MGLVTIGGQYGDVGTAVVIRPLHMNLQRCTDGHVTSLPSAAVSEMFVMLAVTGALDQYDFEGASRFRLELRQKRLSFWIGVPASVVNAQVEEIKGFLAEHLTLGANEMCVRLAKKGLAVDQEVFLSQVRAACTIFRTEASPSAKDIPWGPLELID
jgi:hypothetical protein